MGLFSFGKKWIVAGNNDSTHIDYASNKPTAMHIRFPSLRISKNGKDAQVFHLPTNQWCKTSLSYALENGSSWPDSLLVLPKVSEAMEKVRMKKEVEAKLRAEQRLAE